MNSAKEEVKRILEEMPEDVSLEDIQYHIYVRQKIDRAMAQVDAGQTVSDEQAVGWGQVYVIHFDLAAFAGARPEARAAPIVRLPSRSPRCSPAPA